MEATESDSINSKIASIECLISTMKHCETLEKKNACLQAVPAAAHFFNKSSFLQAALHKLTAEEAFVISQLLALGQGPALFHNLETTDHAFSLLKKMLNHLLAIEHFYEQIGGILGYQLTMLKLIAKKNEGPAELPHNVHFHMPPAFHLETNTPEVKQWVRHGISAMKDIAELYPVGGAGDRLHLQDEKNGEALPVAAMPFCGRNLLTVLIEDLLAREYLYYKLHAEQLDTPVAMMTSMEKNNHDHIINICRTNNWFGKKHTSFRFFSQPLVPMLSLQGDWITDAPLHLCLKPGGHGMIWKQALDNGIFNWLTNTCKRSYGLVRQINNPVAGTDYGLLAFIGIGSFFKKIFGFASCPRRVNTAEGMDVLVETIGEKAQYRISNVEYTEFEKYGIRDVPVEGSSDISQFPANTNILFVDLKAIQPVIAECPIPGMLINMKNKISHLNAHGDKVISLAGRLESTMQNISDFISTEFPKPQWINANDLHTFITFNERRKTLSVTKNAYDGKSLQETPEGCFLEMQQNYSEMLASCGMHLPKPESSQKRPGCIIYCHPAIGPLYTIISQKIRGGSIAKDSEMILEIAEIEIKELNLTGSLRIIADCIIGSKDSEGRIVYGEDSGKCTLLDVTVKNKGIRTDSGNKYFAQHYSRDEEMKIVLHGNAEFYAENVVFEGAHTIEVPNGRRMTAFMRGSSIHYRVEKISVPTWYWHYSYGPEDQVALQKAAPYVV